MILTYTIFVLCSKSQVGVFNWVTFIFSKKMEEVLENNLVHPKLIWNKYNNLVGTERM